MEYENDSGRYEEEPRYDRDRSASPRPAKRDDDYRGGRDRSASPNGRSAPANGGDRGDRSPGAVNSGSNLFVTGIHPRLNEQEVTRLFEKYGNVEGCSIMKDPHTAESRGFGFVKMVTAEEADAARDGLQGENIEGRTLSIEKARRSRPRTPTPGKYFGPPKREDGFRGPPPRGGRGGRYDSYDDRRGGGSRYGGGRDDNYRSRYDGGSSRPDDRSSRYGDDRGYRSSGYGGRRDDYGSRGIDRYASSGRDDRYGQRDDYRSRDYAPRESAGGRSYGDAPPRDAYGSGDRDYPQDDRYPRR